MNIDAYADKLAKRLMAGLDDSVTDHLMDYLEDNLADIIHDAIIDEIRECLTQAVIEAKEEVRNEVSVDKKDFSGDLIKHIHDLCHDKECCIILYGDDGEVGVSLNGSASDLAILLSNCVDTMAEHSPLTRSGVLNMIESANKLTK